VRTPLPQVPGQLLPHALAVARLHVRTPAEQEHCGPVLQHLRLPVPQQRLPEGARSQERARILRPLGGKQEELPSGIAGEGLAWRVVPTECARAGIPPPPPRNLRVHQ
jgi:hypothetical protein